MEGEGVKVHSGYSGPAMMEPSVTRLVNAECGHHYARSMASWASVIALSDFNYSGVDGRIQFTNKRGFIFGAMDIHGEPAWLPART